METVRAPLPTSAAGLALVLLAAIGVGCSTKTDDAGAGGTPQPAPPAPRSRVASLAPVQHLLRASMALRGMRPSLAEIREVEADPAALGAVVDRYLQSPAFGETIRDLHNEALLVRSAPVIYPIGFPARADLKGVEVQRLNLSIVEAPLRLIEHVVTNDRPYTEIVTADYTLADGVVSKVWGVPYAGDGSGSGEEWKVTRWNDGRENAGILSDSALFTRHSTTYSNSNRGRANAVSKALLCYDFLTREIQIDSGINLSDPVEVAGAVRKNPACASCHQGLDPLASFFGAFHPIFVPADVRAYPFQHFVPRLSSVFTITEPAYFGRRGDGLKFLGSMIAQDPRFSLCAAKRFYSYFNQVPLADVPLERASELQRTLIDSGMNAKALVKKIVLSETFRASHPLEDDAPMDAQGLKKIRPRELARMMQDLTGFRWETTLDFDLGTGKIGRIDLMTDSLFGFEVLGGGIDSVNVTLPSHTLSASASLVLRAMAAQAAPFVVASDFAKADKATRKLLTLVSETESAEGAIRAQLVDLELRLYAERLPSDDPAVTAAWTLFRDALAESGNDVRRAWRTTLFAMLQDARIAYY